MSEYPDFSRIRIIKKVNKVSESDLSDSFGHSGVHAGGRTDFEAEVDWRSAAAAEIERFERRCERFCTPSGLFGRGSFAVRKRQVRRRIVARFDPRCCVFAESAGHRTSPGRIEKTSPETEGGGGSADPR